MNFAVHHARQVPIFSEPHTPLIHDAVPSRRQSEDVLGQFVEENLEFSPDFVASSRDLTERLREWSAARSLNLKYQWDLVPFLRDRCCTKGDSASKRGWRGVRVRSSSLKDAWDE